MDREGPGNEFSGLNEKRAGVGHAVAFGDEDCLSEFVAVFRR
jgi:hypothetical protein